MNEHFRHKTLINSIYGAYVSKAPQWDFTKEAELWRIYKLQNSRKKKLKELFEDEFK